MTKKCPQCGREMSLVNIKGKKYFKCAICKTETTVKLKGLSILKEETYEFPVAELKVVKEDKEE